MKFILFPGNPGLFYFYIDFINQIIQNYPLTEVHFINYMGQYINHIEGYDCENDKIKDINIYRKNKIYVYYKHGNTYKLNDQYVYCYYIFRNIINTNEKIIIIGHSIGCYFGLKIKEQYNNINKCILIAPVFERINESAYAKLLIRQIRYKYIFFCLAIPLYIVLSIIFSKITNY